MIVAEDPSSIGPLLVTELIDGSALTMLTVVESVSQALWLSQTWRTTVWLSGPSRPAAENVGF